MYRTLKEAKAAGLRTADGWTSRDTRLIPLRGAVPIVVKGRELFRRDDCEELVSRPEAKRRGLSVPNGVEPAIEVCDTYTFHCRVEYPMFRLSDCVPRRSKPTATQAVDLLVAIFTVNKAAKRCRDMASLHYRGRRHGLAGHMSDRKRQLYRLKDRGIMQAYRDGRLAFVERHGQLGVYRGEGFCFHSTLIPEAETDADDEQRVEAADESCVFIEAAPKGAREARLLDAEATLDKLPDDEDGFDRVEAPCIAKSKRDERWDREPVYAGGNDDEGDGEGSDNEDWDWRDDRYDEG